MRPGVLIAALRARCRAGDPGERPTAAEVRAAFIGAPADEDDPAGAPAPGRRARFSGSPARMLGIATAVGLAAAAALTSLILPLSDAVGRRSAQPLTPLPGPPSAPRTGPPSFASPSFAPPSSTTPSASPSPPPTRVATPPRRAPSRRTLVIRLGRVREVIEAGRAHGELRPDAATDLDQVVTGLQAELAAHRPVALDPRLDRLRAKVADRYREGAVTRSRALEIIAAIDAVNPPPRAAPAVAATPS